MTMQNKIEQKIERMNVERKLLDALQELEKSNLLFFKTLKSLSYLFPKKEEFHALAAVGFNPKDKKVHLILRQDAVLSTNVLDLVGLLEHECSHVLYNHLERKSKMAGMSDRDFMILNQAEDYIINDNSPHIANRLDEIKKSKSLLSNGCFFVDLKAKYSDLKDKDGFNTSSIEIYEFLKEKDKENQKNKKQQSEKGSGQKGQKSGQGQGEQQGKDENSSPGTGESFDEHDIIKIDEDQEGQEKISGKISEDKNIDAKEADSDIDSKVKDALEKAINELKREGNLDKAIGQLTGGLKEKVYDLVKSKTDKNSVINFYTSLCIGTKKTWTALHRRFPYLQKGKRTLKKANILMALDSSGSMGSPELWGMIGYQVGILAKKCEKFTIVVGDTGLLSVTEIKNKKDFNKDKVVFSGGGGTNMQWVFDYAKENGYDGVILHTDGYFPVVDNNGLKSIYYLYGNMVDENHPNAKIVKVYPE